jgi:DNA-binding MarR family transcriptional regulator
MEENPGSRLADVSRLMRRSFDARARGIGVTRPQWQVLTALRRHEGINQGKLADLLDVEPITVCRMVDRLQEADLVERRTDPADRRSWRLFLTPKAHELLGHLRPLADEMLEEAFEGVEEADRVRLMATLDRIRQNLTRRPPGSLGEPMMSHG